MTGPYEWNPPPERIAIRCPSCDREAAFEFGELAYVDDREAREKLAKNPACDMFVATGWANNKRTVAVHYPLLDPLRTVELRGQSLRVGTWPDYSASGRFGPQNLGAILCPACGRRARHTLRWPEDAYYACTIKDQRLWAWTREQCFILKDYIASGDRDRHGRGAFPFLLHVPAVFLKAKVRDQVVKKLGRLLT
jgi:hypothetical protein